MKSPNIFLVLLTSQPEPICFIRMDRLVLQHQRAPAANHIDKLPVQQNSLHSVASCLSILSPQEETEERTWHDWMGGQVQMS